MKITIFCGGPSSEHEISLKSSETILKVLRKTQHDVSVLYINLSLKAYFFNPISSISDEVRSISDETFQPLTKILGENKDDINIALLAGIHGEFAEDGQLQKLLDMHDIPYTGTSAAGSQLCIDKYKTCLAVENIEGLVNPKMLFIKKNSHSVPSQKNFPFAFPVILKPNSLGSSVGIKICQSYKEICSHIEKLHEDFPDEALLITEYISNGVEVSCGCLQKKSGSCVKLPPIEIMPQGHEFFDYASKYDVGGAKEIVPPVSLSPKMSAKISQLACIIHQKLGCATYSRSDFIVKNDSIYFLETNTLPGFTKTSLFPQETAAIGMNLEETILFILNNRTM